MRRLIILGASGTIGHNTLEVCRRYPQHFNIVGLHVHSDITQLTQLASEFPNARCISSMPQEDASGKQFFAQGPDALETLIKETPADIVLNGIAGSAGFFASFWTLESGKDLALANKESLVIAGELLLDLAHTVHRRILPVDSEHWSLFTLLNHLEIAHVKELILTASGGPFHTEKEDALQTVSADQAANHPTWKMGRKISIDSASMANKGLEVIEAWRLFSVPIAQVKVVVHRQSLIHAMVQTHDGALHAHMSKPTMQLAIQNALLHPNILEVPNTQCDFSQLLHMSFEPVNPALQPMIDLAYQACQKGDPYPAVYNAANEAAVALFEQKKILFTQIPTCVQQALSQHYTWPQKTPETIFALHQKVYHSILEAHR